MQPSNIQGTQRAYNYLLSLTDKHNQLHKQGRVKINRTPRKGEVVLIKANNIQRNFWELGRITELVQGSDGEVRTVFLKNSKGNIIQRSVKKLYWN